MRAVGLTEPEQAVGPGESGEAVRRNVPAWRKCGCHPRRLAPSYGRKSDQRDRTGGKPENAPVDAGGHASRMT